MLESLPFAQFGHMLRSTDSASAVSRQLPHDRTPLADPLRGGLDVTNESK